MAWDDGLSPNSPAHQIASSQAARLRVLAGPGTGKTYAMKRRVARLLESGIAPAAILPVTFTKVAAEDLHRELVHMDVEGSEQLRATTLHSLALRALMRDHVLVATGRQPRPLNDFEKKSLERDLAPTFGGVRRVRKRIKAYEAAWAREQHDLPGANQQPEDIQFEQALVSWLRFHRAMLIGEVVPIFLEYLRHDPHAPERTEYGHILVDEYQDLNRAEQDLIELMSANADICIVGDDDQSIYSFKHAHPEGIRTWAAGVAPAVQDVAIEGCYRCPTRVVRMADSLIGRNVDRDQNRHLHPIDENGEGLVRAIRYRTVAQETVAVANLIEELVNGGVEPGHILVLAQRDVIGTPIYEGLVERGIAAKSYYAEAELERELAQERYAYLRLLADTDDRVSLRWLVGVYSTTWNVAGYARVRTECEQTGLSPWAVLTALLDGDLQIPYTASIRLRFEEVRARIDQLRALMGADGLRAVVDELFPGDEALVRDIRAIMTQTLDDQPDLEIGPFLTAVNDAITKPEIPELVEDVRIMSLHKSKGLSSPVTIIAGCVEGLLPRQPDPDLTAQQQLASIEEQRRLFYVGITRVKSNPALDQPGQLILTSARQMPSGEARRAGIGAAVMQYGQAQLNPSRFLGEFGGHGPATEVGN